MDLATSDERALELAPLLLVESRRDVTVWTSPVTGTVCALERSGVFEVSRLVRRALRPTVLGQLEHAHTAAVLADPQGDAARRAAASAILSVDTTAR